MPESFPTSSTPSNPESKESLTEKGWKTLTTLNVVLGNYIHSRSALLPGIMEECELSSEDIQLVPHGVGAHTYYSVHAQILLAERLKTTKQYARYAANLDRFIAQLSGDSPVSK